MKIQDRTHFLFPTLAELIPRAERAMAQFRQTVADGRRGNDVFNGEAGFGFLMVEAQTGLIFAGIALDAAQDTAKFERNTANARKAYDTVLRFRHSVQLSDSENAQLRTSVEKLRGHLQDLGERV